MYTVLSEAFHAAEVSPILYGLLLIVVALCLIMPTHLALRQRKRRVGDIFAIAIGLIAAVVGVLMIVV